LWQAEEELAEGAILSDMRENISKAVSRNAEELREEETIGLMESSAPVCVLNEPKKPDGYRKIRASVDSGAANSVIHPDELSDYPISESPGSRIGQNYIVVNGGEIPNVGQQDIPAVNADNVSMIEQAPDPSLQAMRGREHCEFQC
jgi:hypothetical protein